MFSTKVHIDDTALLRKLESMADAAANLRPVMREVAGLMQEASDFAFRGQYDPVTGAKWPALSPQYAAQRAEKGHSGKMLQVSGQLKNSISRDYGRNFARVGTNHAFASVHQYGCTTKAHRIRAKNAKALRIPGIGYRKSVMHPGSEIPRRRFLGLGRDDMDAITAALRLHIYGKKKG